MTDPDNDEYESALTMTSGTQMRLVLTDLREALNRLLFALSNWDNVKLVIESTRETE
jgi:hypothetical protein